MRIFIAIPLPKNIHQQLIQTTAGLRSKTTNDIRWTPSRNLHLTLRFLGESNPERLLKLQEKLQQLHDLTAPDLSFTNYGVFPSWKAPTTIWLGLEKNSDLEHLQCRVETIARECDYQPEKKPFRPHLTLARVKRNPSSSTVEQTKHLFKDAPPPKISAFQARHVVLFQSILSPKGAQYKALHTFELQQ